MKPLPKKTLFLPFYHNSVNELYIGIVDEKDREHLSKALNDIMHRIERFVNETVQFRKINIPVNCVLVADLKFLKVLFNGSPVYGVIVHLR